MNEPLTRQDHIWKMVATGDSLSETKSGNYILAQTLLMKM
jgi:hypothetical protein